MSAKTYVVTVRSTNEPMGIVSASHDYELFAGIASLADEAGLDISQVEVRDLAAPPWPDAVIGTALEDAPAGAPVRVGL